MLSELTVTQMLAAGLILLFVGLFYRRRPDAATAANRTPRDLLSGLVLPVHTDAEPHATVAPQLVMNAGPPPLLVTIAALRTIRERLAASGHTETELADVDKLAVSLMREPVKHDAALRCETRPCLPSGPNGAMT